MMQFLLVRGKLSMILEHYSSATCSLSSTLQTCNIASMGGFSAQGREFSIWFEMNWYARFVAAESGVRYDTLVIHWK